MREYKYSLRERKSAKTKLALSNAFIERLRTTRFSNISIKDICENVEVSEGTFYNYFPQKTDVISYYHSLVMIKVGWQIEQKKGKTTPIKLIDMIFDLLSREMADPQLFYEFISIMAAERKKPCEDNLTSAEKYYSYPDCPGIEDITFVSIEDFFLPLLIEAKKMGELSKDINLEDIALLLHAILIGTPLAIEMEEFNKLPKIQKTQLSLLWSSLKIN